MKSITRISGIFIFILLSCALQAQSGKESINSNWLFHKGTLDKFPDANETSQWQTVSIPHTWNDDDVLDDEPGYYRGVGWYKKVLYLAPSYQTKQLFLYFEGINQVAEVYVNGKLAGTHTGGYTRFCFPISTLLSFSSSGENTANEIVVKVDNSFNENVPPLTADFTFYGGIYRDVFLIATNDVHFDVTDHASTGLYVSTPVVSKEKATLTLKGNIINASMANQNLVVESVLKDNDGKVILTQSNNQRIIARGKSAMNITLGEFKNPELWSPDHPYLYTLTVTIFDKRKKNILDQSQIPIGFRWFSFDADKGFFLNGEHVKLVGASRHQDFDQLGNALPDAIHVHDVEMLKNMGANFLRVAHYPQDPAVLEACDRLGLLTSVEIPIVNAITESEAFFENSKAMQLEMIRQNFNHPSIIIWAYMNEVLLRPKYNDQPDKQNIYFGEIANLANQIEALTRKEDPSRYTMIPNHGDFARYNKVGLTKIPMLVGWNLYQGWYGPDITGFAAFLDQHHKELPNKPLLVTEYGADAEARLRSFEPERFDITVDYANQYHAYYLQEMMKRPFVAAAMAWNFADFNSEGRADVVPHVNTKGLVTVDRKPKDVYFLYQAILATKPYVKIASSNWILRSGMADDDTKNYCTQPLEVYSNGTNVTVYLNNMKLNEKELTNHTTTFNIPFHDGINQLEVISSSKDGTLVKDLASVEFLLLGHSLDSKHIPFKEINISVGDKRYFIDEPLHQVWLPDQAYQKGSYGYVGGDVFVKKGGQHRYGTDKNILGTTYDPIYQTQRVGLEKYKIDVPRGNYEVTLHFAELLSEGLQQALTYSLNDKAVKEEVTTRIFDVAINNQLALQNINNVQHLKSATAYKEKIFVTVNGDEGIDITFIAKKGQTILNGVQVRKIN